MVKVDIAFASYETTPFLPSGKWRDEIGRCDKLDVDLELFLQLGKCPKDFVEFGIEPQIDIKG